MKGLIILCTMCICTCALQAQSDSTINVYKYQPGTGLRTTYIAVGLLPGLRLGIERPYRVVQTDYIKSNRVRTVFKERYLVYNVGFYFQPRFHNHFMAHVDWQRNRQYPSGFFFESALGFGLSRTLLFQDTYHVTQDNRVKKVPLAGDYYTMSTIGWALGYNWAPFFNLPIKTYIRPGLVIFAPFNNFIYPRTTIDFTVVYRANNLWAPQPQVKHRIKNRRKIPVDS